MQVTADNISLDIFTLETLNNIRDHLMLKKTFTI